MSKKFLDRLNEKSVWIFTKQETDFDECFKAAKLFADAYCLEDINIENYFTAHHKEYGINTDRHRMLVISQFYGLITKTPFYGHNPYKKEHPTAVFNMLNRCIIGSNEYNTLKTEQLLKLKIKSIIDTANNNNGYHVFPVLFVYSVLKKLNDEHGINSVSINHLYTYVLTCAGHYEINEAVNNIKNNEPVTEYIENYIDVSRIMNVIKNLKIFIITRDTISINPVFDEYFNEFETNADFVNLIDKNGSYNASGKRMFENYADFLYTHQGFNINLIDNPSETWLAFAEKQERESESEYANKVDSIKESEIDEKRVINAHKTKPKLNDKEKSAIHYDRDPSLGKDAIKSAVYSCERNRGHQTFLSKTTQKPYMEAHHLVPIQFQKEMWEKYGVNIDCPENLVSLCPTCHKAFHYGTDEVKSEIIEIMYAKVVHKYKAIDFEITLDEIKRCYEIRA